MTAPPSVAATQLLRPPTALKRCSVPSAGLLAVMSARGRSCLAGARHSLTGISLSLRVGYANTPLSGDSLTSADTTAAILLDYTTHPAGLEPRACSDGSRLRHCALLYAGLLSAPAPNARRLFVCHLVRVLRLLRQGYRTPLLSQAHCYRGVRYWARAFITSTGAILRPMGAWRKAL